MTGPTQRLHASCVAIAGCGVLIRGGPGTGKSGLALRLIDEGGVLIADDQTILEAGEGGPVASAPEAIRGLIEVRGLGIVTLAPADPTPVGLIVDLMPHGSIARMPDPDDLCDVLLGCRVARIAVDPADPGAAARIRLAARILGGQGRRPGGEPRHST